MTGRPKSLLLLCVAAAAALGGGYYFWQQQVSQDAASTARPVREPGPLITLESTDGRAIRARILVVTDTSVFIRREDGQTFDLRFDSLTPESKRRVEEARQHHAMGLRK